MRKPKRQELPESEIPPLRVAATPIGNLSDVSARLRQVLGEAQVVLCEDTRRTRELLSALELSGPKLERFDAHSRGAQVVQWVRRVQEGERFVLVTDAGTPGVSDPGSALVRAFHEAGLRVEPVPGPSALSVFLSVCGLEADSLVFWGFFPRHQKERLEAIERSRVCARSGARVSIWFESPERIGAALEFLSQAVSEETQARLAVAKELTKRFEWIASGNVREVAVRAIDELTREGARGEWVLGLEWSMQQELAPTPREDWVKALKCLVAVGVNASSAAREIARSYSVDRSKVYAEAVRLKKNSSGD